MTHLFKAALLACATAIPASVLAAPLELTPANPQPSGLKPGLAVTYAYPSDVKSLSDARSALNQRPKSGPPLRALAFEDTKEGDKVMTSRFSAKVAADIKGFIKFDAPGTYTVNLWVNDGIEAYIGGQEVAYFDERHPCEPAGDVEVSVPVAGWYEVEMLYFQRLGTACLLMEWGSGSNLDIVPASAFGH